MTTHVDSPEPAPLYWEDAAFQAADDLVASEAYKLIFVVRGEQEDVVGRMKEALDSAGDELAIAEMMDGVGSLVGLPPMDQECGCGTVHGATEAWNQLAALAAAAASLNGGPATPYDVIGLIAKKQADYGHDNINAFGHMGIIVRLSDKIARLGNLIAKGVEPENESLQDTLYDIMGYIIIARMLLNGTFNLELEPK